MSESTITLEQIIPETGEFKLKKTGKTYKLRECSIADESWMKQKFGDRLEKIFADIDMQEISKIVFRLMDDKDKEEFIRRDVTFIDEETGEKKQTQIGGAELLYYHIVGPIEKIEIFRALLATIGVSRQLQDSLMEKVEKKTILEIAKTAKQKKRG